MEGQQRANAAQLAARNIRQAKGRQRKTPLKSNGPVQQSMQFGGAGGIFGGGAPPTSSFDFSAPGGLSFPPSTFSNGNTSAFSSPEVSENEDPRADTTGEELRRRDRAFQTDDGPVLFHTPDAFGGVQNSNTVMFGQATANTQQKPSENVFNFKPTTSQPAASSLFNFNPAGGTASNPFSFSQATSSAPTPPAINFNTPSTQDKPANTPFSFLSQPAATTTSASPALQLAQDKPTSNIFGGIAQPSTPTTTFSFGSSAPQDKPATASTPFVFGQTAAKPADATPTATKPSTSLFGASQQPAPSSGGPFSFPQPSAPATTSNIFGNTNSSAPPASGLFGSPKPALSAGNIFGQQDKKSATSDTSGISNGFQKPAANAEELKSQPTPSVNIFGNVGKAAPAATPLFGSSDKQAAPATNIFAGLNSQKAPASDLFGNLNKPVQQPTTKPETNQGLSNGTGFGKDSAISTAGAPGKSLFGSVSLAGNEPSAPLFSAPAPSMPTFAPSGPGMSFGSQSTASGSAATSNKSASTLFSLNKPVDASKDASKQQPSTMFSAFSQPAASPKSDALPAQLMPSAQPGASNGSANAFALGGDKSHLYRDMTAAASISEESMRPLIPTKFNEEQRQEFYVTYRMRSLNKAMQGFFANLSMGSEISGALAHYQEQRAIILGSKTNQSSKPIVGSQAGEAIKNSATPLFGSQPSKSQATVSPQKPSENGSQLFGAATPKLSPAVVAPPSSKGKRKAEVQLTKDDDEREEAEGRMRMSKVNDVPAGASNTSNIFKNIVDSPTKTSPEKKIKPLASATEDDKPRFNPFASLPVPPSTTPKAAAATPAPNVFASTKPAAPTSNPFQPKVASTGAIKPPTFGTGPVDFMAQFNKQASKSEEKMMEEAKAEDMDSDEDEAEWEAKWKAKRKAELKAIEDLGKSKRATFSGGKFSFGQGDQSGSASPEKGSVSSSSMDSRTPTPAFGSSTGSVFDGHVPGKPTNFGQNIFGHLSDADSGADSGKGGDQDSDSGDEETENEDSENKDPSYQPGSQQSSSRTSPEEVGQGTTPKKPLFESGAPKVAGLSGTTPTSGTSTPGGSLFDRITRDPSGNPIRHVSSDEKENTQPMSTSNVANTVNPFARSFDGAPADQTWKPNTPIKFGATPSVNVTSASPTPSKQASPFANLFGNSETSEQQSSAGGTPKPTSSLFAGLATSKPMGAGGVGFNFGSGLSTTTSSLFPSAAVSATTSRATTPGGTTDGDSPAEADPDAEHHEQINLTAGGPGEEDEDVIHEIRAKALQWSTKNGAEWQTKGVGPLRVLKHKDTGATRILLRADPSGTVVLNKSLLAGVKYEVTAKTIKFPAAGEEGKGFETWLLQLKTPEFAKELGEVMEGNKPSS